MNLKLPDHSKETMRTFFKPLRVVFDAQCGDYYTSKLSWCILFNELNFGGCLEDFDEKLSDFSAVLSKIPIAYM